MIEVTKEEAIDNLLANKCRAIEIYEKVDCDGSEEDILWTIGYVAKSDKHVPLHILKRNMDMYDFLYIVKNYNQIIDHSKNRRIENIRVDAGDNFNGDPTK